MNLQVSLFELRKKHGFAVRDYDTGRYADEGAVQKLFETGEYGMTEQLIAKGLYKYQYLNRHNIERIVNLNLNPRLKKKNYARNLHAMVNRGTVLAMDYTDGSSIPLTLYFLSKGAAEYVRDRYRMPQTAYRIPDSPETEDWDAEEIMQRMSLNQWHISVLAGRQVYAECYYGRKRVGSEKHFFYSFFVIRPEKGKEFAVVSIPAAKGSPEEMINEIKRLDDIFAKSRKKNMFLFINCESQGHIIRIQNLLDRDKNLRFVSPVYTSDPHTARCSGLRWLYTCRNTDGVCRIDNFDFTS